MKTLLRILPAFLSALLVTFSLASVAHSQFVLHQLAQLGIQIDLATRLSSTLDDWIGLLPGYGGAIAVALLLGFGVIAVIRRFLPNLSSVSYIVGGFLAMACTLLAMHPLMQITLIAGARDWPGFICQCLAGAVGGWLFQYQSKLN